MEENTKEEIIRSPEDITQKSILSTSKKIINNKWVKYGVIVIILLIFATGIYLLIENLNKNQLAKTSTVTNQSVKTLNNLLRTEEVDIKNVLVPYVPHFEDLLSSDLITSAESFTLKLIGKYENNFIISSQGLILEYDPIKKQIVRMQDKRIFNCNSSFAMIGDYLYTACNAQYYEENNFKSKERSIYKLDLKTGNVIKRYFEYTVIDNVSNEIDDDALEDNFPIFINVDMVSLNQTLWVGVRNGIFSIETNSDIVHYYNREALGTNKHCNLDNVWSNEKYVWTECSPSIFKTHIAVFDPSLNDWVIYNNNDLQKITSSKSGDFTLDKNYTGIGKNTMYFALYNFRDEEGYIIKYNGNAKMWELVSDFNRPLTREDYYQYYSNAYIPGCENGLCEYFDKDKETAIKLDINFGIFNSTSNLVNGKRYIVGDKIYTLKKQSFPVVFSSLKIPIELDDDCESNVYVTKDEKFMLIITGPPGGIGSPQPNLILVDLINNNYSSLLQGSLEYSNLSDENAAKFGQANGYYQYEEIEKIILIKNKMGNELFSIDTVTNTLTFK